MTEQRLELDQADRALELRVGRYPEHARLLVEHALDIRPMLITELVEKTDLRLRVVLLVLGDLLALDEVRLTTRGRYRRMTGGARG